MNVTLEEAYREAVAALGEALVRERLLSARIAALEFEAVTRDADEKVPPITVT